MNSKEKKQKIAELEGKIQEKEQKIIELEGKSEQDVNARPFNIGKLFGFVIFVISTIFTVNPSSVEQAIGKEIFAFIKLHVQSLLNMLFTMLNQKQIPDFFETVHLRFYAIFFIIASVGLTTQLIRLTWLISKTLKNRDFRKNLKELLSTIFSIVFLLFLLFIAILKVE